MVEVEFNLMLAGMAGRKRASIDVAGPMRMKEFVELAGLRYDDVGMLLINKAWAPVDSVVADGDYVQLYPHLEGG